MRIRNRKNRRPDPRSSAYYGGSSTQPDGPNAAFRRIEGNSFNYFDFPGPAESVTGRGNLTSYRGEWDFAAKVINGNQQCEVNFHISMTLQGGNWGAHWGSR